MDRHCDQRARFVMENLRTYSMSGNLDHVDAILLSYKQWLSGRVPDLRPRGLEPHRRYCVVSLSKNITPSLVLVQPRKTVPHNRKIVNPGRPIPHN